MAVRTLDQILSELSSTYEPQLANVRRQQELIPQQIAEEEKGLGAKQEQAFGDIVSGARRRGLGFSGIPLAEQAKYTSTEFLPALARLKQQGRQQAMSLEDAILGITERRNTLAQQLQQQDYSRDFQERQMAEQRRQFDENLRAQQQQSARAAASAFSPTLSQARPSQPSAVQKAFYSLKDPRNPGSGFNFTDAQGKPISALRYSQLSGVPFTQLVRKMADAGDAGARSILPFARDTGFVGTGVGNQGVQNLIRAFGW